MLRLSGLRRSRGSWTSCSWPCWGHTGWTSKPLSGCRAGGVRPASSAPKPAPLPRHAPPQDLHSGINAQPHGPSRRRPGVAAPPPWPSCSGLALLHAGPETRPWRVAWMRSPFCKRREPASGCHRPIPSAWRAVGAQVGGVTSGRDSRICASGSGGRPESPRGNSDL